MAKLHKGLLAAPFHLSAYGSGLAITVTEVSAVRILRGCMHHADLPARYHASSSAMIY